MSTDPTQPLQQSKSARLLSLDALRGFDMFWIIGGEAILQQAAKLTDFPPIRLAAGQLQHKAWGGFAFYDLIFPMFVFVVGVSLVFSLSKLLATQGKLRAVRRVIIRAVLLYLLGILYYGGLSKHYHDIRLLGVLQRIALCYLFASLMFIFLSPRAMAIVAAGILIGYWALLSFVPVRGVGHTSFVEGKNWPNYIDSKYLPLRKWDGDHDPEGLLSTLPAIVTCVLGVFAGSLLKSNTVPPSRKFAILFTGGAVAVGLGFLWGLQFPVIKKLWTSTFVLVAGGYSAMLLATFYLVIDIWKQRWWAAPFIWIGMNAITLYLLDAIIDYHDLAARFIGGQFAKQNLHQFAELAISTLAVLLMLAAARFLYSRQIFLRV